MFTEYEISVPIDRPVRPDIVHAQVSLWRKERGKKKQPAFPTVTVAVESQGKGSVVYLLGGTKIETMEVIEEVKTSLVEHLKRVL